MSRTYQQFKDYLITYLWKKGDQELIASLDALIRAANDQLNRELRIERRHTSRLFYVDAAKTALPLDYHSMRVVSGYQPNVGEFKYVNPAELQGMRNSCPNSEFPVYSIEDRFLTLAWGLRDARKTEGPTPPLDPAAGDLWYRTTVNPGLYTWFVDVDAGQWVQLSTDVSADADAVTSSLILNLNYIAKVPDYKDTNASWVEDEFGDLYTYAVLMQTAPFLREDERLPNWVQLYDRALASAIDDSEFNQKHGVFSHKPLSRQAGVHRRRR